MNTFGEMRCEEDRYLADPGKSGRGSGRSPTTARSECGRRPRRAGPRGATGQRARTESGASTRSAGPRHRRRHLLGPECHPCSPRTAGAALPTPTVPVVGTASKDPHLGQGVEGGSNYGVSTAPHISPSETPRSFSCPITQRCGSGAHDAPRTPTTALSRPGRAHPTAPAPSGATHGLFEDKACICQIFPGNVRGFWSADQIPSEPPHSFRPAKPLHSFFRECPPPRTLPPL